uniref:VQ domain-containing protein n=1 Tax=Nelumbo nucifera TaxID=4432 RepID=A0A822ZCZ5_NELNU|nr:TPA_asm: hypothetical protein HUJ06_015874 [Nelumbo nucifera]
MDPINYAFDSSSSSCSADLLLADQVEPQRSPVPPEDTKTIPFLHSVRKSSAKPWKKPGPPPPPRVYRVDSRNFRQVVQQLTGSPDLRSRRLQRVAPPPLNTVLPLPSNNDISEPLQLFCNPDLSQPGVHNGNNNENMLPTETHLETKPARKLSDWSSSSLCSSPSSSFIWNSLLSPGTLASLDQSTLLY